MEALLFCDEQLNSPVSENEIEEPIPCRSPDLHCYEIMEFILREVDMEDDIIRSLIKDQHTIKTIEGVTTETRATIIESMLTSGESRAFPRAIHLAVQIFDRYLSENIEGGPNHQTVASLSLYIAVKYEYGISKDPRMTFATSNPELEFSILKVLDYRLHYTTTNIFVEAILHGSSDTTLGLLCSYLTELSLIDIQCSLFPPSLLAVACVFLAKFVLNPTRSPSVESQFYHTGDELIPPVKILHDLYTGKTLPFFRSTRDKYRSSQFACEEMIPAEYFDF